MIQFLKSLFDYLLDAPDPAILKRQEIYARQQRWLDYLTQPGK
jgi:hypothetical protein